MLIQQSVSLSPCLSVARGWFAVALPLSSLTPPAPSCSSSAAVSALSRSPRSGYAVRPSALKSQKKLTTRHKIHTRLLSIE